nr:rho GTPase-activating protein 28 isoform X3 [Nerophis lumbriciformis]
MLKVILENVKPITVYYNTNHQVFLINPVVGPNMGIRIFHQCGPSSSLFPPSIFCSLPSPLGPSGAKPAGGCCHLSPPALARLHLTRQRPLTPGTSPWKRTGERSKALKRNGREMRRRKKRGRVWTVEVELEEAWLTEAGLSSLVTGLTLEEAPPPAEALLSTLTHQQAATVKARLDNYKHTMRERNRPIRDVRDVFASDSEASPASPSQCTESPPSRYHTTTKTIRRNTTSVRPRLPNCYLPDDTLFPANTPPSFTHTSSPAPGQERHADWLVRDCPYSEGVAEHKRGMAHCWDCLRFQGEDSKDTPFVCPPQGVTLADDLSSGDLKRLGFICHIELSTFLQALGVQTKRTRPTRSRGWGALHFLMKVPTRCEKSFKSSPSSFRRRRLWRCSQHAVGKRQEEVAGGQSSSCLSEVVECFRAEWLADRRYTPGARISCSTQVPAQRARQVSRGVRLVQSEAGRRCWSAQAFYPRAADSSADTHTPADLPGCTGCVISGSPGSGAADVVVVAS